MKNTIRLLPNQEEHTAVLRKILAAYPYAMDLSMLGTGKTFTATHIALDRKVRHVIVVAPVSVLPKWEQMRVDYGLPVSAAISFQSLRSVKDRQPTHGLLSRHDSSTPATSGDSKKKEERVEFKPTEKLLRLVDEGALIILDEIQNVKNAGAQLEAAAALLSPIVAAGAGSPSRALLLSGSPIDKIEHAVQIFRCLGLIQGNEPVAKYLPRAYSAGTYTYPALDQAERALRALMPDRYEAERPKWDHYGQGAAWARTRIYDLFQHVVKPVIAHAMPPAGSGPTLNKFNGMFQMTEFPEAAVLLSEAVSRLAKACNFNPTKNAVVFEKDSMAKITSALVQIESYKTGLFVRLALEALTDPTRKVVICVNYTDTLNELAGLLASHKPLLLHGSMTQKQRAAAVAAFQAPNADRRLLLANLAVASTGIDLDDKHGGFPRTCYASPIFNTITLYQLGHRFQRMDTRSDATIYMVYGAGCPEANILNALARKGSVMKETTTEQAAAGVLFPCDFPDYLEGA